MPKFKGVLFFGLTEIAIGMVTLCVVLTSVFLSFSQKPLNVLVFVITASLASIILGMGILRYKIPSLHLLRFFAGMIILSKILISAQIISLHGALETNIPTSVKNVISFIYHAAILIYFSLPKVKESFRESTKG